MKKLVIHHAACLLNNNYMEIVCFAGLRIPHDQRKITSTLPMHLVDVLSVNDGVQTFSDVSGDYGLLRIIP